MDEVLRFFLLGKEVDKELLFEIVPKSLVIFFGPLDGARSVTSLENPP